MTRSALALPAGALCAALSGACASDGDVAFGRVEVAGAPDVVAPGVRYDRTVYAPPDRGPDRPAVATKKVSAADRRLAQRAYRSGMRYFSRGSYSSALRYFLRSERYNPRAETKYRIAKTYDRMGRRYDAVRAYRRFVDSRPGSGYSWRVREARRRIRTLSP